MGGLDFFEEGSVCPRGVNGFDGGSEMEACFSPGGDEVGFSGFLGDSGVKVAFGMVASVAKVSVSRATIRSDE